MSAPDSVNFEFRIDRFTAMDLPMRRLAEYLDEFAKLLGEEASTRLADIAKGSTIIVALALPIAVPKVRARLSAARDGVLDDARRAVNRLDAMLSEDNTSGTLVESGDPGVIIRFPGANARTAELPAVAEIGSLQGELIRIGGRDDTAHATLRDGSRLYTCIVSHDLARGLGRYLFGPSLRLHGRGRWRRSQDGLWEPVDFRAHTFDVLDDASLSAAAEKLRAAGGFGHPDTAGVWESLRALRAD
jgi:hypothetical protein